MRLIQQFPREIFSGNWQSVIRKALFKVGQMENVLRHTLR